MSSLTVSLPSISSYGKYSSENYGAHCLVIEIGQFTVWFSYQTPVAFQCPDHPRVVRENQWGPTTGKHLNWIDNGDKKSRVSSERFEQLWAEQVNPLLAFEDAIRGLRDVEYQ